MVRLRPHTTYFINEIHKYHPISLVVVEAPSVQDKLGRILRKKGLIETTRSIKHKLWPARSQKETYDELFGDQWKALAADLPIMTVQNINAALVHERLQKLAPNLLLDHGTSIVKDHVLDTADLALNLHWGLSPYYRGVACTEWALINWDPYNIGVTIHRLSKRIDGGDLLTQKHVEVEPSDTVLSINCKITREGTQLLVQIIDRLEQENHLHFVTQETDVGFLYLKKHFNNHLLRRVRQIEQEGLIPEMLKKPARKARLPIVKL